MQRNWRNDTDKLTFILCLPPASAASIPTEANLETLSPPVSSEPIIANEHDVPEVMIGDINLFLSESHDELPPNDRGMSGKRRLVGELELMIARKEFQGQGYGRAAVLLFLWYVVVRREEIVQKFGEDSVLEYLAVKINQVNDRSIGLFTSLGFKKTNEEPNYFGEFELVLKDLDVVRMFGLLRFHGLEGSRECEYVYKSE
jgi:RimJ/RimL family protein N-acetyltransferase